MRLLIALTYYRPHVSGLSICGERLARGMVRRGHQVTVLTSRFDPKLAARECVGGVNVIRVPVAARLSKGVIMPAFVFYAAAAIARHDVVNIHMPQFESSLLALLGRVMGKRVVATYHCDLRLPAGWFNRVVEYCLAPLNHLAAALVHRVVASTDDYAECSSFLRRYARKRVTILLPVELRTAAADETARLKDAWGFNGRRRIGFAARFAAEKGVEHLLAALPAVLEQVADAHLVFTGAYKNAVGEAEYRERLRPLLERHRDRLTFMELLRDDEMASFFALCQVLAVTSLNSTEAFGVVQVEAMLQGTPVVATDLPGVREAVRRTGMGEIVPPADSAALAAALVRVLQSRPQYVRPPAAVRQAFNAEESLDQYERIFAPCAPGPVAGV